MSSSKVQPPRRATVGDPTIQAAPPTNIDRRKCRRVVPMKVLCLGLSRTGTASTRQALIDLGYEDCYHYASVLNENPRDCAMWIEAFEAKYHGKGKPFDKSDWDQLLGHCMAATDTPCALFPRELLTAYPDAKVILTVRDNVDQWYNSMTSTIMEQFWDVWFPQAPSLLRRIERRFIPMSGEMLRFNQLLSETPFYSKMHEDGKGYYERHNAEIQHLVRPENLLVFNVKQGWEPICEFLDKDVPPWSFPKTNERAALANALNTYNQYMLSGARRKMAKTGAFIAIGLLGVYGGWKLRERGVWAEWVQYTIGLVQR